MRRWLVITLVGLTVAVVTPILWWANQPPDSVGLPVAAPVSVGSTAAAVPLAALPDTPSAVNSEPATRAAAPRSRPEQSAVTGSSGRARLTVPALNIDAPIVSVGVQQDGSMEIPEPVQEVGWYRHGPAPGSAEGSAVLAGHVDSAEQGKGALFELREVDVGTEIDVTLDSGQTVRYRVTGRETFTKERLPTERLFTRTGAPRLVIITCGGPFIEELSSYRDNVVVAAEPVT